jgi:hypothetical protein
MVKSRAGACSGNIDVWEEVGCRDYESLVFGALRYIFEGGCRMKTLVAMHVLRRGYNEALRAPVPLERCLVLPPLRLPIS